VFEGVDLGIGLFKSHIAQTSTFRDFACAGERRHREVDPDRRARRHNCSRDKCGRTAATTHVEDPLTWSELDRVEDHPGERVEHLVVPCWMDDPLATILALVPVFGLIPVHNRHASPRLVIIPAESVTTPTRIWSSAARNPSPSPLSLALSNRAAPRRSARLLVIP
jgi:hypothetical protein